MGRNRDNFNNSIDGLDEADAYFEARDRDTTSKNGPRYVEEKPKRAPKGTYQPAALARARKRVAPVAE